MPMLQRFAVSESSDADSSSDSSASPTPVNKRRCVRPESSSSSSSRDEQSEPAGAKPAAGLMLNQLVAMNEGKKDVDQSVYAKQAVQPERIQQVLQETCCKKNARETYIGDWFWRWSLFSGYFLKLAKIAFYGLCSKTVSHVTSKMMSRSLVQTAVANHVIKLHGP